MVPIWQIWVGLGIALGVLEVFTSTFYVLWFGVGAIITGLVTLIWPSLELSGQIVIWVVLSSLIAALWFAFGRKRPSEKRWSVEEVIGEIGLLTVPVSEFQKGRVRFQKPILGAEEWPCISDQAIAAGERVRLVKVEGATLRIIRA